jgi:hypothetical protein
MRQHVPKLVDKTTQAKLCLRLLLLSSCCVPRGAAVLAHGDGSGHGVALNLAFEDEADAPT